MNVVGKNIKKLRISQGMTQEELAEKCLSQGRRSAIGKMEKASRT